MTIAQSLEHSWIKVRPLGPGIELGDRRDVDVVPLLQLCSSQVRRREDGARKPERRRLRAARLREYSLKSHSSMPRNTSYASFERFSRVLEDVAAAEQGLRELQRGRRQCRERVCALRAAAEQREARCRDGSAGLGRDLRRLRTELGRTEALRTRAQEEARAALLGAGGLKRRLCRLENRYDALAAQVAAEVQFVRDLVRALEQERLQAECGVR